MTLRDDAGRWILWVGLDGSASLYRKDGDACEHVASVPEKPME